MGQVLHKFRTTLGGFNRRDVMNYIEGADVEHRRQVAALEEELEKLRAERDELSATLAGLQNEKGTLDAREAQVRASLEESTRTLTRVRGELSQAESKLGVAKQELSRRQAQVEQMEPLAKSYEELKDRVATVELDAHKKAQATMNAAQAEAEQIRGETRQWLTGILGQYDRLRQAVDGLDSQLKAVGMLADGMKDGSEAVQRLKEWGELE